MTRTEAWHWACNSTLRAFDCYSPVPNEIITKLDKIHTIAPAVDTRVVNRTSGHLFTEFVEPSAARGLALLYNTNSGKALLDLWSTQWVLKLSSKSAGTKANRQDTSLVNSQICCFVDVYSTNVEESEKKITEFATINEFFSRALRPGLRPVGTDSRQFHTAVVSPADCRISVFESVSSATSLWIKGQPFSIHQMLQSSNSHVFQDASVLVARLAPQDYHRWHFPLPGRVGRTTIIPGQYRSVNDLPVKNVPVFDVNTRHVTMVDNDDIGTYAIVAVGATQVGSIIQYREEGDVVNAGDQAGTFEFGGSTVVVLFQQASGVIFDADLVRGSSGANPLSPGVPVETLVNVNEQIGAYTFQTVVHMTFDGISALELADSDFQFALTRTISLMVGIAEQYIQLSSFSRRAASVMVTIQTESSSQTQSVSSTITESTSLRSTLTAQLAATSYSGTIPSSIQASANPMPTTLDQSEEVTSNSGGNLLFWVVVAGSSFIILLMLAAVAVFFYYRKSAQTPETHDSDGKTSSSVNCQREHANDGDLMANPIYHGRQEPGVQMVNPMYYDGQEPGVHMVNPMYYGEEELEIHDTDGETSSPVDCQKLQHANDGVHMVNPMYHGGQEPETHDSPDKSREGEIEI